MNISLDIKLVFNRLMYHYILLIEIEDEQEDVISFKLLGVKIYFGWKDFDIIITKLRNRPGRAIEFELDKPLDCDDCLLTIRRI